MNFHRNHWLLLITIILGFLILSLIIAVAPAYWVQAQVQVQDTGEPLSGIVWRGLEVYVAEGCVACHTQQVRPLEMDEVWGRPSAPGDYAKLGPMDVWRPYAPAVLGSSRIGPDLSDVGDRQPSETWHYLHLFNPRSVVDASIMPAYPWLFDVVDKPADDAMVIHVPALFAPSEGEVVPNERGEALVAYLLALQQEALDGRPGDEPSGRHASSGGSPSNASGVTGATLYGNYCASCHQNSGLGIPGVFPPLVDDPVVLAADAAKHIDTILHGAHGEIINGQTYAAPMPGFSAQLDDREVAAIVNHERTSWGNTAPTVNADDVARRRGAQK